MDGYRHIVVVAGALLTSSPLAMLSYYGNVLPYLASYFYARRHTMLLNIGPLWTSTAFRSCFSIMMIFASPIEHRFGIRRCISAGLVLISASILSGYFAVDEPLALALTFGATHGLGLGLALPLSQKLVLQAVSHRGGVASGIMYCGAPLLALLNIGIAYAVINPNNEEADLKIGDQLYFSDPDVLERVPFYFAATGAVTVFVSVIGVALLYLGKTSQPHIEMSINAVPEQNGTDKRPTSANRHFSETTFTTNSSSDIMGHVAGAERNGGNVDLFTQVSSNGHVPNGAQAIPSNEMKDTDQSAAKNPESSTKDLSPWEIFQTFQFWLVWVCAIGIGHTFYVHVNLYKQYGQLEIHNDMILMITGLIGTGVMVLTRPLVGVISDRIGARDATLAVSSSSSIFMSLMVVGLHTAASMYILTTAVELLCCSIQLMVISLLNSELFGKRHHASNLGLVCSGQLVVFLLEPFLIDAITRYHGWDWVLFSGSISAAVSMVTIMILNRQTE